MEISIKMIMNMVQTQNCKIWLHFQLVSRIYYFLAKKNFSSVSARKLKCSSSARLGSEPWQLGLARAGKFQLEPISNNYIISSKVWWVLLFRFWIEKSHFKRNTKSKWSGKKVNLRKQFWYGVSGLKISRRKPFPALLVSWGWMFLSLSWFLPVWVVRPFFCLMIGRSTVAENYKYKCFCNQIIIGINEISLITTY